MFVEAFRLLLTAFLLAPPWLPDGRFFVLLPSGQRLPRNPAIRTRLLLRTSSLCGMLPRLSSGILLSRALASDSAAPKKLNYPRGVAVIPSPL